MNKNIMPYQNNDYFRSDEFQLLIKRKNMITSLLITTFLYKVQTALAALISAMLLAPSTSTQMPVQKDTFEKSDRFEYVTSPVDTLGYDVYVLNEKELVGNKERGEQFNKWFWNMVFCANDDGSFNYDALGDKSLYFRFPEKDYKQLATDIISTFDVNEDNNVDFHEYVSKSEDLVNACVKKTLPEDVMNRFRETFFQPWFKGFDYDDNKKEYNLDELAATLYAMDRISSGTYDGRGYIRGDKMLYELGYVMDNGRPDKSFQYSRIEYYENNGLE